MAEQQTGRMALLFKEQLTVILAIAFVQHTISSVLLTHLHDDQYGYKGKLSYSIFSVTQPISSGLNVATTLTNVPQNLRGYHK